ncbi:MAG: DUF523 domain-containing protein [Candidatus Aenigmatarchaeota archaeon]
MKIIASACLAGFNCKIARMYGCEEAILKEGSPSCGCKRTFYINENLENKKVGGMDITTALLIKNGIKVYTEEELE